jgi:hypothetical protein
MLVGSDGLGAGFAAEAYKAALMELVKRDVEHPDIVPYIR